MDFLETHYEFDHVKAEEITSVSFALASKISDLLVLGMVGTLYYSKICKDLALLIEFVSGELPLDVDEVHQVYENSYEPIDHTH